MLSHPDPKTVIKSVVRVWYLPSLRLKMQRSRWYVLIGFHRWGR
jgi:hypothetical protein